MSLTLQTTIFTTKKPATAHLHLITAQLVKSTNYPSIPRSSHLPNLTQNPHVVTKLYASYQEPYTATPHNPDKPPTAEFDSFLSFLELLTLSSSAAISVYILIRCGTQKVGSLIGSRVLIGQCVVLVIGVLIGAVIRRRQWMRICGDGFGRKGIDGRVLNVLDRVEKLEEELSGTVRIVHGLSRRLEKLGIRFRVTRKSLKEPIAETAVLAQKNSEATRELSAQGDILEKELGEIQKVLLAMQEQQQKQLELILAIGKAGKLWENKGTKNSEQKSSDSSHSSFDGAIKSGVTEIEVSAQ